jgi:hypothetical protein
VSESILNKALEFLGEGTTPPAVEEIPKKPQLKVTKQYEKTTPAAEENPLLTASQGLKEYFPNLIFEDQELDRVASWIRTQGGVCLDIETYGASSQQEEHKKEALSFVRGTIRLIQLSAGGETYTLDAALLTRDAVARTL